MRPAPFGGDSDVATAMARLTTSAPPIRPQRPDVPPALDDIVHRCMARDPAHRFPSASAVRTALAAVRTNPQGRAPRPAPGRISGPSSAPDAEPAQGAPARPRRSGGMTWFWVGVVFVLAIAAAVVAFVIISDDQSNSPNPDTSTPATARHFDVGRCGAGGRNRPGLGRARRGRRWRGAVCVTTTPTSPPGVAR